MMTRGRMMVHALFVAAALVACDAKPKAGKNTEAMKDAEAPENPSCADVVGAAAHACPRTNLQAQTQEYIDAACTSAMALVSSEELVVERVGVCPARCPAPPRALAPLRTHPVSSRF